MYYRKRQKRDYYRGPMGTLTSHKFDADCKLYTTDQGVYNSYNNSLALEYEETLIDYSETKSDEFPHYSSTFPSAYAHNLSKPCKHYWRAVDYEPESRFVFPAHLSCATGWQVVHDGDWSEYPTYWHKPETQLTNVLPRRTLWGSDTSMQNWTQAKDLSLAHLPFFFRDSRLLNLEQCDVATFLAELRDVKQLGELIKFKKNHLDVSDKFLGVSFGVLPIVSDIKKMYENIQKMPKSFDSWNEMADKETTRTYHHTTDHFKESGVHMLHTGNRGGLLNCSYSYMYEWEQEYREVIHIYVKPHRIADTTDLTLQASLWGLDKPLSTIWNLVPLSFAVDWVVDIGGVIQDFEYRSPDLSFDIVDACFSRKLETKITTSVFLNVKGKTQCVGRTKTRSSEYIRVPIPLSNCQSLLETGSFGPLELNTSFSPMQITLSAALAHQRAFK